jgi:hypothetical protein
MVVAQDQEEEEEERQGHGVLVVDERLGGVVGVASLRPACGGRHFLTILIMYLYNR